MNHSRCPPSCWLLCMTYACHLLDVIESPALGGITPLQALTGQFLTSASFSVHLLQACILQG